MDVTAGETAPLSGAPGYSGSIPPAATPEAPPGAGATPFDDVYARAVELLRDRPTIGPSYVQRHLGIGYDEAAVLLTRMTLEGLVGTEDWYGQHVVLQSPAREGSPAEGSCPAGMGDDGDPASGLPIDLEIPDFLRRTEGAA